MHLTIFVYECRYLKPVFLKGYIFRAKFQINQRVDIINLNAI